jgi:hypothetical protein
MAGQLFHGINFQGSDRTALVLVNPHHVFLHGDVAAFLKGIGLGINQRTSMENILSDTFGFVLRCDPLF